MNVNKFEMMLILLMSLLQSHAQKPSWVDFEARRQNYPQDIYLTGFSSSKNDTQKKVEEQFLILSGFAKSELVESINVTVSSQSLLHAEENSNTIMENFSHTTVSFAKAELPGLKTGMWEDSKSKQLYAFAYIRISDLCDYYRANLLEKREKVLSYLQEAEQSKKAGRNDEALRNYRESLTLIKEMEESASIILALTKQSLVGDFQQLSAQVRKGIEEISHITATSPREAAEVLADAITEKLKNKKTSLMIFPFTYQDSRLSGEFSGSFLTELKQKVADKGLTVIEPTISSHKNDTDARLTGVYWLENNLLRLSATLSANDGSILACAEALLTKDWFTSNNIGWQPERFEDAAKRMKGFTDGEIIGGGLNLELWTNKGDENLLFKENDTVRLFVRSNHECYLRFIYYMADDSKVLLMNDYYIGYNDVNKVIQIPEIFVCSAPYGSESLVLNGQTNPFPKLQTKIRNGYTYIEDDLKTIVSLTRGFKRLNNQMLNGEKRLIINTIK